VQGVQEAWVRGKAEALASQLKLNEKTLATTYRRFGLNINALLAFAVLVLLPELPLLKRFSFLAFMVLVGWALARLHAFFVPNAAIRLSSRQPSPLQRAKPEIISWVLSVGAAIVAAIAYGLLKGELSLPSWLSTFF